MELPPLGMALGGGMVALVALVGGWWVLAGEKRREDEEEVPTAAATATAATVYRARASTRAPTRAPATGRPRPPADWELASAIDDAPIGTVDFDPDADELPPDIQAALDAPVIHTEPGNARTRRIAQMHDGGDQTDRRSLLYRIGLPDAEEDF